MFIQLHYIFGSALRHRETKVKILGLLKQTYAKSWIRVSENTLPLGSPVNSSEV
jgi:hypothetical protein